jgi:NADPH:quinone reductase
VVFDGIAEEGYRRSWKALKQGGLLCAYGFSAGVKREQSILMSGLWISKL